MGGTGITSIKSYDFYRDSTLGAPALTVLFAEFSFVDDLDSTQFLSCGVLIANDAPLSDIYFSWDGVGIHGRVTPGTNLAFDGKRKRKIYLRGALGGEPYRFWAW